MGWWGHGALSGDAPLDCLGNLMEEALGVECDYDSKNLEDFSGYPITKEILERSMGHLHEYIKSKKTRKEYYYHVLGTLCLYYGVVKIPRALKAQILIEIADDEWAKEDRDRRIHMDRFYEAFKNIKKGQRLRMVYDGEDNPKNGTFESILPNSIQMITGD